MALLDSPRTLPLHIPLQSFGNTPQIRWSCHDYIMVVFSRGGSIYGMDDVQSLFRAFLLWVYVCVLRYGVGRGFRGCMRWGGGRDGTLFMTCRRGRSGCT